jgi:site-specific DNA recombinase
MSNTNLASNVIMIPANPEFAKASAVRRQLRVAAYCRVSTDSEEQLTSYEAQRTYYTDKIMSNPEWTMAGLFADEGITGTSAQKRPEFLRMICQCRQKKIDLILTKSVSRFARNTVDSLKYVRILKELGIAVFFEEQNINTLDADNEMLLTIHSAFSQAESETMSSRVKWGKREAMREGKAIIQYNRLYGYRRGDNNKPEIIPEQAEVVRRIYQQYLTGASLRMIQDTLEGEQVLNVAGKPEWSLNVIRNILTSEKYCGDVLMQKTYISDCISRKTIRNNGQLPKYLLPDHHEAIVDRQTFDAVQAEMARRSAGRSPSRKNAPTGRTSYASKYALSERLVCGECGTLYRRCVWAKRGKKRTVWRCVSRLDYGTKYCHNSPSLDEEPLQRAILTAINSVMRNREDMALQIAGAMELQLLSVPGQTISLADIQRRIEMLESQFNALLEQAAEQMDGQDHMVEFQSITSEIAALKEQRMRLEAQRTSNTAAIQRMSTAASLLSEAPPELTVWDETVIRQVVDTVKVVSENQIVVYLQGGAAVTQEIVS